MSSAKMLVLRQGRLRAPREAHAFRNVLVPLDGSAFGEVALDAASALAEALWGQLVLIRVHQPHRVDRHHSAEWDLMVRSVEEAYLERICARVGEHPAFGAEAAVLEGEVAEAICAHAAQLHAPLIVMSSHGRTGLTRTWLGSVADAVIRHAAAPVLIVRPPAASTMRPRIDNARFETVLVALDGSSFAAQILPHAAAIADALHAQVRLLRVVALAAELGEGEDYLASTAERIRFAHAQVRVSCDVRVAQAPAPVIAASAAAAPRCVVALATHGRGLSRLIVGSVADAVIRGGAAPVLLVRPSAI